MRKFSKIPPVAYHVSCAITAVTLFGFSNGRLRPKLSTAPAANPMMVVELFTSEACPDCPSAEDSLVAFKRAAVAKHVTLVPLSFHVAYWNQDGWVDPYSDTSYTQRQKFYTGGQLYTPQVVVNGVTKDLSTSLLNESPASFARAVTIEPTPAGAPRTFTIHVAAPAVKNPSPQPVIVYLAVTEDSIAARPSTGENKGRMINHLGVVRYFTKVTKIGDTTATIPAVTIPAIPGLQHGHIVALVQTSQGHRLAEIIGVGTVPLKE